MLSALAGAALSGCAGGRLPSAPAGQAVPELPAGLRDADFALLGEVHDNGAGHALRLGWLRELTRGRRRIIAMEQFDAPRQADLDAARTRIEARAGFGSAGTLAPAARELAEAAGFAFEGWQWPFYEPVLVLALARGLPLVAANSPRRREAPAVGAPARPQGWGASEDEAMAVAIRDGHCGLLPEAAVTAMAGLQRVRDATMAGAMVDARRRSGLPVVLLAGNGHVRTDIGVPRHLASLQPSARMMAVAIGERGRPWPGSFDAGVEVAPVEREDPCLALRRRFGARAG
jgi:uncharacterized iron-regulated protein